MLCVIGVWLLGRKVPIKCMQLNGGMKESSWVTGLCNFFERNLCEKLQTISNPKQEGILFHESFIDAIGEDTFLNWMINHRLGLKNYINQDNFIYHYGHVTLDSIGGSWHEQCQHNGREILKKNWPECFPNG